ncbi:MAG: ribonuclease H-like domain-containing protein [Thermoplasmata archaeon]|nr:ribonuclease H-like domain-containing protein [Thermoplasmata archaeon]
MQSTFVHVPGIGYVTERKLWDGGLESWDAYLEDPEAVWLGPVRGRRLADALQESMDRLRARDHRYFASHLPRREYWRAYREFGNSIAYVDIETTGLESERDEITVIGLFDGRETQYFYEDSLEDFPPVLARYRLLVTFNGSTFDVPFLERTFPTLRVDQIHIDLRYLFARLGLKGGLKAIEGRMGIRRSPATEGVRGWDAVYLWRRYQQGDEEALRILLQYNGEDVVNLEPLLEIAYDGLRSQCLHPGFRTYSLKDLPSYRAPGPGREGYEGLRPELESAGPA